MFNYNKPIHITEFKRIYVKNIGAHGECDYEIVGDKEDEEYNFQIVKKGKGLLHRYYVQQYLNIFNHELENKNYLNNLCKIYKEPCIIHFEINSLTDKSITLLLFRDEPNKCRLQLKNGSNIVMLKLDKSNLQFIQYINGLIHI